MSGTLTLLTKQDPDKATEWPDHVKGLAFELYYTDAGRSLTTLAEIIAGYPYEHRVPYSTLSYWRRADLWDIEADKMAEAFAPNRRRRTASLLNVAAELSAAYLVQVQSGAVEPNKLKITAAKIALDASGFAAIRVPVDAAPALSDGTTNTEPLDMSPAAAIERIRQRYRSDTS